MVSVIELLAECERRDIRLELQDDRVACKTPRRDIPDDLAESLRSRKAEITIRLKCDNSVQSTLERINAACPMDWKPTAGDWQRIDRAETTISEARRENDRSGLLAALADYELVAVGIFTEQRAGT